MPIIQTYIKQLILNGGELQQLRLIQLGDEIEVPPHTVGVMHSDNALVVAAQREAFPDVARDVGPPEIEEQVQRREEDAKKRVLFKINKIFFYE